MRRAAAVAAALLLLSCGKAGAPPAAQAPAPDFTLSDLDGRTVTLSGLRGQVVLIDFWATWCGPCLEELPDLAALHRRHAKAGFAVLGVSVDDTAVGELRAFAREYGIPYPVLPAGPRGVKGYRLMGIPTAFLIDRQGRIAREYIGLKPVKDLEQDVVEALAAPAPAPAAEAQKP